MGLNRAFDRQFFIMNGAVKTSGGSLGLTKGQLALIDQSKTTATGAKIVANAAGKQKDAKDFVLRCGVADRAVTRSRTDKDQSTMPFSLNEIVELRVDAPKNTKQKVDEVIIGYDGMNPNSAFKFKTGDSYFRLSLELKGGAIAYRGGKGDTEIVNINVEVPNCDSYDGCVDCDECAAVDCKVVTLEAIERLKRRELTGGRTVGEFVDITPVFSCDTDASLTEVAYDYYCLEVCDTGTDEALALVEAQYDTKVIRTDRTGSTSKYQLMLPASAGAPADYGQTIASIIKGCSECPAGWDESPEGFLYVFTILDSGADQSALFTALPGYVAGTIVRADGHNTSIGQYSAIFDDKLTDGEINTLLTGAAPRNTVTISEPIKVSALCSDDTVTETAWVQCGSCNVISEDYTIVVPDNECGETRLAEIQANYAGTVTVVQIDAALAEITLTGTAGRALITIDGIEYYVDFNTNLSTTADDFVTSHASAILYNHNMVVTANAGVLSFIALDDYYVSPTITNVFGSPDLNGTIVETTSDLSGETVDDRNACQTRYQISVISNIVCEECDPIFKDYYITEAPTPFDIYEWEKVAVTTNLPDGNCLCGIKFKAKEFVIDMEESLRDLTGFVETSVQIRVSGGYPEEIREGIGRLPQGTYPTKYLSKWEPRTHLAGNLRDLENESRAYFRGTQAYRKEYLGRVISGETTNMEDQTKQYVQYTLTVDHFNRTQSFAGRISEVINYDIFVEVGRHNAVEQLLNNIASAAGKPTVQAFGA